MKVLLALLKREILESSSIWIVPVVMLIIGLLIKLSMSAGSLAIDVNLPNIMNVDEAVNNVVDSAVSETVYKGLWFINGLITFVMVLVATFYTLSCLYTERQDQSVLFWRSLPVSDAMTIISKLLIALVLIPFLITVCHLILSVIFLGGQSVDYLQSFILVSVFDTAQMTVWLLLPLVAWCLLCSAIAKKPFLLAFITPVILVLVDMLFFDIGLSELILDRFHSDNRSSFLLLVTGLGFSCVCIFIATIKRRQQI